MSPVAPRAGERCWSLFGLTIATEHRFANRLRPSNGPADLWLRQVDVSPLGAAWRSNPPAYRSPLKVDASQHFLDIVLTPDATVFSFADVVDFFVFRDGIAYQPFDPTYRYMIELHLLGYVLSYWLERAGWPALHASAVVIDGEALAFLSSHGGGKTSLAASLLREGFALLTDDVLAVSVDADGVHGLPGYPQMRMWPDQASHFVGQDDLEFVHPGLTKRRVPIGEATFGRFEGAIRRVSALYLPERRDGGAIEIVDTKASTALFGLVRHSFLAGIVEALGLGPQRMASLASVVQKVPVRTLRYPTGVHLLPEVVRRVRDDVRVLRREQTSVPTSVGRTQ